MNEMQIFTSKEFGDIRTVENGSNPLFVGIDVAARLGYSNKKDAVLRHCKGVVKRSLPTNGGNQDFSCIPCGDVLRLVASSKLPGAQRFESWIFDEVMPSIMRTGKYIVPTAPQPSAPLAIAEQLLLAAKNQEQRISAIEEKQSQLEKAVNKTDWLTSAKKRVEAITGRPFRASGFLLSDIYNEIRRSENVQLTSRLARYRKKILNRGATAHEVRNVSKLYIISLDEKLKAAFDKILDKREAS